MKVKTLSACFIFLMLFFSAKSFAEYRAYRLKITNALTGQERSVLSTLDHIQYPQYHAVNANDSVQYVESWMCKGNTSGYKPICAQPSTRSDGP